MSGEGGRAFAATPLVHGTDQLAAGAKDQPGRMGGALP